jgi:hypothetical protein
MSEYAKLKNQGLGRGRPRLSDEERESRRAINQIRQEARRRAGIVLQRRHSDEYENLVIEETNALMDDSKKKRSKK